MSGESTRPPRACPKPERDAAQVAFARQKLEHAAARPEQPEHGILAAVELRRLAKLRTPAAARLLAEATARRELAQLRGVDGLSLRTIATDALLGMGQPHARLVDKDALALAREEHRRSRRRHPIVAAVLARFGFAKAQPAEEDAPVR